MIDTIKLIYKVDFLSDWHCGSGLSAGTDVDCLCIKDEYNLPFIPGKTIKGLLKESANIVCNKNMGFVKECFGISTVRTKSEEENSEKGKCFFSNAELSLKLKEAIANDETKKKALYRKISSTAIDDTGEAKEHSLRKIEVVIPLTLYGEIVNIPDNDYKNNIIKCIKYIKRLGTNRNRGLGRCVIMEVNNVQENI